MKSDLNKQNPKPRVVGDTLFLAYPVKLSDDFIVDRINWSSEINKIAFDMLPVTGAHNLLNHEIWPIAQVLSDQSAQFLRDRLHVVDKEAVVERVLFISRKHQIPPEFAASLTDTQDSTLKK